MTTTLSLPVSFDEMVHSMLRCEQTAGQSVYQHGRSVYDHLFILIDALKNNQELSKSSWKLPDWIFEYKPQILDNIHSEEILQLYTLYHDCGKNLCKIIDEDGKIHFPNHAQVSKEVWLYVGGNLIVGDLIGWDMILHQASSIEIGQQCEIWTVKDAVTLLLASLAEIHSNAKIFSGIDSISFKAKFKQIERRGKQICKFFFNKQKNLQR